MGNHKPKIFAYYLPQFHSFKENDEWWGKGFTEWTNVGKAKSLFHGHDQPRVPTELGYYNLKMPEVREEQAQLAREAGVDGFLYWHYWFGNGKTLMADIFKDVLESGKPDFPFALAWANHSWYAKGWNKDAVHDKRLLIAQEYPGEEDIQQYFETLLPAFKDSRYIKVDGKPLFLIYDPTTLPDIYLKRFKELAVNAGLGGLYLIANIVRPNDPKEKYLELGYDAVTYQRLSSASPKFTQGSLWFGRAYKLWRFAKGIFLHRPPRMSDYSKCYHDLITDVEKEPDVIPAIVPQWDHTPRSGWNGTFFINSEPQYFKLHALEAMNAIKNKPEENQILILKSWNEWGEGNYMEPDITHGRGYIDALRQAIEEYSNSSK